MAYGDFNNIPKRAVSYNVLRDKRFDIVIDIKEVLLQWFIIFLVKSLLLIQEQESIAI